MKKRVAVIGGGLSGTLLSIYLLQSEKTPLDIRLWEKKPERLARGLAYQKEYDKVPLNVRAEKMSLFADRPGHFAEWIKQQAATYGLSDAETDPKAFLPRSIFGDYLRAQLEEAKAANHIHGYSESGCEAVAIEKKEETWLLKSETHEEEADIVVLATGLFAPGNPPGLPPEILNHPQYTANPWQENAVKNLPADAEVLLLGSGLTAFDQLLGLRHNAHSGQIHLLSRRGLLPREHSGNGVHYFEKEELFRYVSSPLTLLRYIRSVLLEKGEENWTAVIDALRPYTATIWSSWDAFGRGQFLRHVRPWWEVCRHRIPQVSQQAMHTLLENDQLQLHSGRILSATLQADHFEVHYLDRHRRQAASFRVTHIINCTGPGNYSGSITHPLTLDLLEKGLACRDEHGLGLLTDESGRLSDAAGQSISTLYTLGSPRKATIWESTALHEIRGQAAALAALLCGDTVPQKA